MRYWRATAVVVGLALALVVVAVIKDDSSPQARKSPERPAKHQPRQATERLSVYVDIGSVGGECSDRRTQRQAAAPETPVCGLEAALALAPPGGVVRVVGGPYPRLELSDDVVPRDVRVVGTGDTRPVIERLEIEAAEELWLQNLDLGPVRLGGGVQGAELVDSVVRGGVVLDSGASAVLIAANDITSPGGTGVFFSSSVGKPTIENVTIRGNRIHDLGVAGVNARNFRNVVVEGNEITGVTAREPGQHTDVIRTFAGGSSLIVRNNVLHDNSAIGIFTKDGPVNGVRIENNVILRTTKHHAISLYDAHGVTLANNTVAGNEFGVVLRPGTTGVTSINNIFQYLTDRGAEYVRNERNIVGGQSVLRFNAPDRLDYRLTSASPAVDAGTSRGAPAYDTEGRFRVDARRRRNRGTGRIRYVDIGAYEYGSRRKAPGGRNRCCPMRPWR